MAGSGRHVRHAESMMPMVGLPGDGLSMKEHGWWWEASEEHERAQHGDT